MSLSSVTDRVFTPRVALIANIALVFAGSVLALLGMIDMVSGILIVVIGFVGIAVTYYA